jgi:hypothetical protein
MSLVTPSSPVSRACPAVYSSDTLLVGLPIGLGALSGYMSKGGSRSAWYKVSLPFQWSWCGRNYGVGESMSFAPHTRRWARVDRNPLNFAPKSTKLRLY